MSTKFAVRKEEEFLFAGEHFSIMVNTYSRTDEYLFTIGKKKIASRACDVLKEMLDCEVIRGKKIPGSTADAAFQTAHHPVLASRGIKCWKL